MLNIDVAFRVVRSDTALEFINAQRELAEKKNLDAQQEINEACTGAVVVTGYNNRTYRVDHVDFASNPSSTFDKNGTVTSFKDYYKAQYNQDVTDLSQPLLVHKDKKTGREVLLIPELCKMTGLNDAMRADFRLMKDLAQITHTDAQRKANECKNLLESFKKNEKC
jgi:aubergine-like protein